MDTFVLVRGSTPEAGHHELLSERQVKHLLERLAGDERWARERALATLRDALGMRSEAELGSPSAHGLGRRIALALTRRGIRLRRRPVHSPQRVAVSDELPERDDPLAEDVWVHVEVVREGSGEAIGDVQLHITSTTGLDRELSTGGDGMVRLTGVPPARFAVTSPVEGATIPTSFVFVGKGAVLEPTPVDGDEKGEGPFHIVDVVRHRVRSGESLESISERYGITWQALAEFNFGTSAPDEVNDHLRFELGCTKSTDDGKNALFDDEDRPGVLLVPRPWAIASLASERVHTLRVEPLRPTVRVRIDDPLTGFLSNTEVRVTYADGSKATLETDDYGILDVALDRWGDEGNFVDLEYDSGLRTYMKRVFIVLEHATSRRGVWQRLVNLGHVDDTAEDADLPPAEPPDDDALEAALEEFQADAGLVPTGELDAATVSALRSRYRSSTPWGDRARTIPDLADEVSYRPKHEVA